jgi:hypothetical protein
MKLSLSAVAVAAALLALNAFAQAPASAPAGATGLCKDGSYTSDETKRGACSGHKGVKAWFGATTPTVPVKTATPGSTGANPAPSATRNAGPSPSAAPAAGGGPGQVWVNSASKVYHCSGTKYYGKTKKGQYMTEAAAKAAGAHADHGKTCS